VTRATRAPGLVCVIAVATALVTSCEPPDLSLRLSADKLELVADGTDRSTIAIDLGQPAAGVVVELSASAGLLNASTARLQDGHAEVQLTSDLEAALGPEGVSPIEVTATIRWSDDELEQASLTLSERAPLDGPPVLFLSADPPAADADGQSRVELSVIGRRVPADSTPAWTTSAGTLVEQTDFVAGDDGVLRATAVLVAPEAPADALVEVRADDAAASVGVRYVAPGSPQFDLNGTWVQLSPARVRLRTGTLVPNPQCVVAPSLILTEVAQSGLDVDASFTTCELAFPAVTTIAGQVTTTAPPSFIAAIPVVQQSFSLSGPELGAVWQPPPSVVVGGAALSVPATDELPSDPDDERIRDDDMDGAPGMTVLNSLGNEQNVVFRNIGQTRGRVLSSVEILGDELGDLVATTETSVLSIGALFLPEVEGLPSVVQLLRVDGRFASPDIDADGDDVITCAEAIAAQASLFELNVPATPFDCVGVEP
jgi:hypothetical protein